MPTPRTNANPSIVRFNRVVLYGNVLTLYDINATTRVVLNGIATDNGRLTITKYLNPGGRIVLNRVVLDSGMGRRTETSAPKIDTTITGIVDYGIAVDYNVGSRVIVYLNSASAASVARTSRVTVNGIVANGNNGRVSTNMNATGAAIVAIASIIGDYIAINQSRRAY